MIDLKYHIGSLVAVFLALAVGILIGTSMVGAPSVENQIRRLKSGFDKMAEDDRRLRLENEQLRQNTRVLENGLRQVAPNVVRDRIPGKRVAIILSGQVPDAGMVRGVKYLLTTAGATLSSITTINGNLLPENPEARQELLLGLGVDRQNVDRARKQLAARLVQEIVTGDNPDLVRFVGRLSPGLGLDGDYGQSVDAVLLFPAADSEQEAGAVADGTSVQARLADVLREIGVDTIVCEQRDSQFSLMPHFARYNLTTVDGVDTPLGQIALVYALAGKQGHYGTKPSAAQVLPDLDVLPVTAPGEPPTRSQPPARPERGPRPASQPRDPGQS